jgi:16S rRNA (cytosine967-C5)-methyltransferase
MGTLRWQVRLEAISQQLLKKPLKAKDSDIAVLIQLGLYQILYMNVPEHAAVGETVALTARLKKPWAKGLVNGVLRNFLRQQDEICAEVDLKPAYRFSHPQWLTKALRKAYPQQWENILNANNAEAPLFLRINPMMQTRDEFIAKCKEKGIEVETHPYAPQAVKLLSGGDITQLPSYDGGGFSVQDVAAQQAAHLLNPQPGERILDACAAPGGKTTHLQELAQNQVQLTALEKAPERLERLSENLHRLQLDADVLCGDASQPGDWWDGELFDKILLDAPCSATGIIRRHPDIKIHRTAEDIEALTPLQSAILDTQWQLLKPGGILLYATCSTLPAENSQQIEAFLDRTPDAKVLPIEAPWGSGNASVGKQILPGEAQMDGFYYCLLQKSPNEVEAV